MHLVLQEEVVDEKIAAYLKENHITTRPYDAIYDYVKEIPADACVLMNGNTVNYRITSSLKKEIRIVDQPNPTEIMKAVKNPVEVENIRKAHVKDGVAFTKFMYWLKTNIGKIPMTEISASDYLEARRREQDNFIELSFDTICAYGPNAAMMHYAATPESDAELKPEGFCWWIPADTISRERPTSQERWRSDRSQTRCGCILQRYAAPT